MTTFNVTSLGVPNAIVSGFSSDGRYVSYIVEENGIATLYVRDVTSGATTTVASTTEGIAGAAISADGRYVFYGTGGSSTNPDDSQLWVKDLQSGASATDVTPYCPPQPFPGTDVGFMPLAISADGEHVVYDIRYIDNTHNTPNFFGQAVLDVTTQTDEDRRLQS